jgi:hypothetical protein
MTRIAWVLLCSCSLLCGCSFTFVNAPKAGQPCNDSEASPIADSAISVLTGLTTISLIGEATGEFGDRDAAGFAVVTGALTATFVASAVSGFSNVGKCRKQEKQEYDEAVAAQRNAPPEVPAARKDAWQMTKQAQLAARSGDCETVATLDQVVSTVDPEFYRTVFMRDAAIAHCMSTREIPVEPPATTPQAGSAAAPQSAPPTP